MKLTYKVPFKISKIIRIPRWQISRSIVLIKWSLNKKSKSEVEKKLLLNLNLAQDRVSIRIKKTPRKSNRKICHGQAYIWTCQGRIVNSEYTSQGKQNEEKTCSKLNIIIKKEKAALFVLLARTSKRSRNLEERSTVVNKFVKAIEQSQINLLEKNMI